MTDLPIVIRQLRESDAALILDSWINSIRFHSPCYSWVPARLIGSIYRELVGRLLSRRPDLFRVLVNEEDEDQIFGWRCGTEDVTHFCYVKEKFRGMGLASMLIGVKRNSGWTCSHWTKDCERIEGIQFRPSLWEEVIRGIDQAVGGGTAQDDKHAGKIGPNTQDRQPGKASNQTARVDA